MEEQFTSGNEGKKSNGLTVILLILILILASVSGVLLSKLSREKSDNETIQTILENQKNTLVEELTDLQSQFGAIRTDNDTLREKVTLQQEHIEKLLQINASNAQKIKTYQKELGTLREVLRSYIAQVDSLNTKNIALTNENKQIRSQMQAVTNQNQQLQKDKEDMTSKIEVASIISIADLSAVGLNNRGRENDRVKSVMQIRACGTVRANAIVAAGERPVFIRITAPSGNILSDRDGGSFSYQGQTLPCSASRVINYDNQDIPVCIYWDNDGSLTAGSYKVEFFIDGNLVGSTSLLLK